MRSRWLCAALLLFACKVQDDQASRPLPAPEPPADTRAAPAADTTAAAPRERSRERPTREAKAETEPAAAPSDAKTPAPTSTAPGAEAEPAATAAAKQADPSCQQTCQAGLQACLSQQPADPDGGTSLDGLAGCKRALDECKTRCSP